MILFVNAAENKCLVWEPGMVAWAVEQPSGGEAIGAAATLVGIVNVPRRSASSVPDHPA